LALDKKLTKQLIDFIIAHPECPSRTIIHSYPLSKYQLAEFYKIAKSSLPKIGERTLGKSQFYHKVLSKDLLAEPQKCSRLYYDKFVFPDMLELHLGQSCQCACVFCWRWNHKKRINGELGLYRNKEKYSPLNLHDIETLIAEFKNHGGKVLYLSGGLEFFTSNHAADVIRIASKNGLSIRAYTNGVSNFFQNTENQDLLLHNLEYIRFSLHASTHETYQKVLMPYRNGSGTQRVFNQVRKNIKDLISRRKNLGLENKCEIYIAFLATGLNYFELIDSLDYWKDKGIDSFDIRTDMTGKESWFTKSQNKDFVELMDQIKEKSDNNHYEPMKITGERLSKKDETQFAQKCYIPFKKPAIDPWGFVYPCCYTAHPSIQKQNQVLGKFPENTLYDILYNSHEQQVLPLTHCDQCTDWEMTYNQCVEKMIMDWRYGFGPDKLPF